MLVNKFFSKSTGTSTKCDSCLSASIFHCVLMLVRGVFQGILSMKSMKSCGILQPKFFKSEGISIILMQGSKLVLVYRPRVSL